MQNIMKAVLGVVCLLRLIGSSQSVQLSLRIDRRHLRFRYTSAPTEAKVLCVLQDTAGRTVPLAGCQFTVYGQQEIWEFSQGPSSPRGSSGEYQGSYQGRGLQHGECGVTVTGFNAWDRPILGCRVRPANQDVWMYETMMMLALPWSTMDFHLQPQVTLAAAGSDVTINGTAEHVVTGCWFWLPPPNNTVELNFTAGHASDTHSLGRYHGAGFQHKQCGVTLLDVKPERSGFVSGLVRSSVAYSFMDQGKLRRAGSGKAETDFTQLIVLTAPEAPLLTVNTTGLLAPGHVLHATCVVKNSRPVANLTWILGDEVIREDNINEAPLDSKWRWGHDLQTIKQHLEHVVTLSDDGKRLKCKASHVALASGSQDSTSHVIHVGDPCLNNPCGDHSECRVNGDVAVCSCQEHFVGSPPSCRPECSSNTDCSSLRACVDARCVDPCTSRSCGDGAQCHVAQHVAECKCLDGLIGDPLTRCEKGPRDPCQPNPCGDNSECRVEDSLTLCRCKEHFIGSPTYCQPECYINLGCESFRACVEGRCVDPCSSKSCGDGAQCHVAQHVAECKCLDGLIGDPLTRCEKGS